MKVSIRSSLSAICLAAALAASGGAAAAETYYILVNSANVERAEGASANALLRRLYLKQQTTWPDGEPSLFFARSEGSEEETAFRAVVLSMTDSELNAHWIRMKQTRGLAPPRAVASTRLLIRQLQTRPDAVGIVSREDYDKHAKHNSNVALFGTFATD